MTTPRQTSRQALYQRLPEIYHIKDQEQLLPDQLSAFLGILDEVMAGIRDNVEDLRHDFFIETCAPWVIPYLADLLGVSHLSGDAWTLRADVARTVFHRRRKGTLGSIESLTYSLSGWAAQAVEFRDRLVWNQHLNHQRPDAGGQPPLSLRNSISSAVRGGTVSLRDPALLSFLNGPFDPFAHVVDVKPGTLGAPRHNLPNLGIYLWRLKDYQIKVNRPGFVEADAATSGNVNAVVRCIIHPQADPMPLFNTYRFRTDDDPPELSRPDEVPGPMPMPRLNEDAETGNPHAYVAIDAYAGVQPLLPGDDSVGLVLHVPVDNFPVETTTWRFRGANLCAWESGLNPPLEDFDVVVDPELGRVLFGLPGQVADADPLAANLFVSYTYGFSGPSGAHPVTRTDTPAEYQETSPVIRTVSGGGSSLETALANLGVLTNPLIIEIEDNAIYTLDLTAVSGIGSEGLEPALTLGRSLWIRAISGARPVIILQHPLRFRPLDVLGAGALDIIANMEVRLEGLYLTCNRSVVAFAAEQALIQQAAINRLVIEECTLDPGGARQLDPLQTYTRQDMRDSMRLGNDYGFVDDANEEIAFAQTPVIEITRSITGALAIDDNYLLRVIDSIIDGNSDEFETTDLAVHALTGDPDTQWGPTLEVNGMTCFGRMRVHRVSGQGGIWVHRLEAQDVQFGCVKFSYFSGDADQLPPHHACVIGNEVDLHFTAQWFGIPGYGQLSLLSDHNILEQGPNRDAMGAFGYLLNTHKFKNISIRYREFMPVGIRPVLIPVT